MELEQTQLVDGRACAPVEDSCIGNWAPWRDPDRGMAINHQALRDIVVFTLATGLRQSNVVRLRWSQVDLERRIAWIAAEEAKGSEDIHVSLSDLALEVLGRQRGKHSERVFTYGGQRIRYVKTKAWCNALKRVGITDFRWHDLHHSWASWLIQMEHRYTICRRWGLKVGRDSTAVHALGASTHGVSHGGSGRLLRLTNTARYVEERITAHSKKPTNRNSWAFLYSW